MNKKLSKIKILPDNLNFSTSHQINNLTITDNVNTQVHFSTNTEAEFIDSSNNDFSKSYR
jgi:hypothetical protein